MKRILVTISATVIACAAATAAAAEDYVYVYVNSKDAKGGSARHRLECQGSACKTEVNDHASMLDLSDEQRGEILAALQAETRQVTLGDAGPDGETVKLKIKYEAPHQRLSLERRLSASDPDALTPQMRAVLKAYLEIDLRKPVPAEEGKGTAPAMH